MIFFKNISSINLLETELVRLKVLYMKALASKNETAVKMLRKTIKQLKTKIAIASDSEIDLS